MLRNCQECNRIFSHPTRRVCDSCYKEQQKMFDDVKTYLQEHPGATVAEVSQETEVDVDVIYDYIRQGRLNIIPSDVEFTCEICGTSIKQGRVCASCRSKLGERLSSEPETEKSEQSRGSRVHYLDQIKDRRY